VNDNVLYHSRFLADAMKTIIFGMLITLPNQFFTDQSFFTVAGASAIVFVVCNSIQAAFNFNPRWLALLVSEVIALYGTYASRNANVPSDYFLSLLNGCLIFCTAVGGTALASSGATKGTPRGLAVGSKRRTFSTSWF